MEKILEELNSVFENKYGFLKLYDVVYDQSLSECCITLLYPQTISEISHHQREEITNFIKEKLQLNTSLRVRFKKSFLDARLVKAEVLGFINKNYKASSVYVSENSLNIIINDQKIDVSINLPREIYNFFLNNKISSQISNFLKEKFICEIEILIEENPEIEIEDKIEMVETPILFKRNLRYEAFVVKDVFGGDISPNPEFIKDNKEVKKSVILAGTIQKFTKKSFTRKKGKRAGEEGFYYTFMLDDGDKIDCVYFSTKTNIKKMDCLEDGMTLLCVGDLNMGMGEKLTYYITKLALATIDTESKENALNQVKKTVKKSVVKPEIFNHSEQENLFKTEVKYKDFVYEKDIVVFDLETTGLDAEVEKIIEIGAVKIQKGKVTQKFWSFVNPEKPIPFMASKINHIYDEMVESAPLIEDVLPDFFDFCEGCVLSGYNIIGFDNKFIKKEAFKMGLKFDFEVIDAINLARSAGLGLRNYKLSTVSQYFEIENQNAHRAYEDAFTTAKVLLKLCEEK